MERENLEGLRILYTASEILFYLWVFKTETHDELVKKVTVGQKKKSFKTSVMFYLNVATIILSCATFLEEKQVASTVR